MVKTKKKFAIKYYDEYYNMFAEDISYILTNNKRERESKEKTAIAYKQRLKVLIEYFKKYRVNITKLDKYDVEKLFKHLKSRGYTKAGKRKVYSNARIKGFKVVATKFFEFLKSEKVIDRELHNPFGDKINSLKNDKNYSQSHIRSKLLTQDQVDRILDYILNGENRIRDKDKLYSAVLLMLSFGLRVSELERLSSDDFSITDRNMIKLHVKKSKRGKERDTYYIYGNRYRADVEDIISSDELKFKSKTVCKQVERVSKVLDISNLSPHSFRHTYCTTYLNLGGSIESLSKLVGHDSIITTQIYGKILNSRVEDEIEGLKEIS